eukprot:scaffold28957_cov114-Skeletonema_menzelii.AAC.1
MGMMGKAKGTDMGALNDYFPILCITSFESTCRNGNKILGYAKKEIFSSVGTIEVICNKLSMVRWTSTTWIFNASLAGTRAIYCNEQTGWRRQLADILR